MCALFTSECTSERTCYMKKMTSDKTTANDVMHACTVFARALYELLEVTAIYDRECAVKEKNKTARVPLSKLRSVLAEKTAEGYGSQVKALIEKFGGDRLSDVDHKYYPAMMEEAEEIGKLKI